MSCYCSPEREVPSELWLGEGGEREAWHEGEVPTEVWLVEGQVGEDGEGSWSVVGRLIATISLFSVCMT
jgi:hypothetical protein